MEKLNPKTITCLKILQNRSPGAHIFRDSNHIFGVVIVSDKLYPERNGLIVYGPNNSENCQAFILGMKEVMHRKEEDEMIVEWVNIRRLIKAMQYEELIS